MRTRIVRTLIQNIIMNPIHERLIRNFDWLGLGKVVGGVVDGVSTLINGKKNREAQAAENQKNRDHAEKMYNLYESPVAQAQQMREAGLNPMGAIAPTSVGSASTASLPASETPSFGSAIVDAFGMKNAKTQSEILESQNRSAKAQATIDESDAIKAAVEANDYESYHQIRRAQDEALRDKYQHEAKSAEYKKLTDEAIYNDFQTARKELGYNQFANEQTAADDAHQAALDAHDSSQRSKEIHDLSKQLMNKQIDYSEFMNRVAKTDAERAEAQSLVLSQLNVEIYDIPVWLRPAAYEISSLKKVLDSFDKPDPGTPKWYSLMNAISELSKCKVEFEYLLDLSNSTAEYDSSYSNRKREDVKATNQINDATWDRESSQRATDNLYKGINALSNLTNSLYNIK